MLEEVAMDKKLMNRSAQSPKGVVETKKNQDVTVGKSFPKQSRKREKPGQKVEYLPKKQTNACQKSKHHGRKPGPKPYLDVGAKNAELECFDDDLDTRRSKKQNLAHLLNFHCKPRSGAINTSQRRSAPNSLFHNTIRTLMSTQKHKYNKEQFLQANCRFVIRSNADYSVHLADPDILVDWNLIEQILVASFEPVTCPICLEFPTAGKITRCGHIYCWSCILHYLSLTDKSWHKCPICFEAVHNKDLKSVKLSNQKMYAVGDEITFRLMAREHGSTVAIPVLEANTREPNVLLPVSGSDFTTVYSKLLEGDYKDILKIIDIEEIELNNELKENEGCPEICFVEQAVQLLNERREQLFKDINKTLEISGASCSSKSDGEIINEHKYPACEDANLDIPDKNIDKGVALNELSEWELEHEPRIRNESVSAESDGSYIISAEDLEIPMGSPSNALKDYFFYQAEDGQQIFLYSLNARMLQRQFGSLERAPSTIRGTIVEIETGSMTEELRKRLRYLQHLPVTCQFQVVEIKFIEPVIAEEHLTFFKDQLDKRARQREKRAKDEQRLEKKAQQLTRKQFGNHSPPRRLRLDSLHHFPECGSDTPPNLSPSNRSPMSSRTSSPQSSTSRRSTSPMTKTLNSLSLSSNTFAQKLKESNKEGAWTKRATVIENEAGSSHSRNLISDAVEVALIKARMEREADKVNTNKGKKKKKQKQIPLCSVGMVYGNR